MLFPVYRVLFDSFSDGSRGLNLHDSDVVIQYKTYKTDNSADMKTITDQKLAPGKNFSFSIARNLL